MKSLKFSSYSTSTSPILIIFLLLTTLNYLVNKGSNMGSKVSSMSSIKRGWPILTQVSRSLIKVPEAILVYFILFSYSRFFIHLLAYNCGSITKGKALLLNTNIPLLIDTESEGRPFAFQFLITTGCPNTEASEYFSLHRISHSLALLSHKSTNSSLYVPVKGP